MTSWKKLPWLAIDSETTGPEPATARIVELGCVHYQRDGQVVRRSVLVNPGVPIPAEATEIHGIHDEDVAGQPELAAVAQRFLALVAGAAVLVGYNWPYDAAILARELGGEWARAIAGKPVIDPLVVVRFDSVGRFWKGQGRHKLGNVAARLNLDVPGGRHHRASADALLACLVLERLLDHLPDDATAASALIERERRLQDEDFQAWRARQPARPAAAGR